MFGVSGYLYRENLVLYDNRTNSLWSQLAATAIRGPRTGNRLELLPSTVTQLGTWREENPDTRVLLPPPRSGTVDGRTFNYNHDRFSVYYASRGIGRQGNGQTPVDDRLHPKMQVLGVAIDGTVRAYPYDAVKDAGVVNDWVGTVPVVVAARGDRSVSTLSGTLVAYDRRVDNETLQFRAIADGDLWGGASRWSLITGRATNGPYEGTRLTPVGTPPMFWFVWRDRHPETTVWSAT